MTTLLMLAAGTEVLTGLVLIGAPSGFARLLFGGGLSAPGLALAPLAGIALLALAVACWPVRHAAGSAAHAVRAMLLFSLLAALYLIYRGIGGETVGPLLWPAAVFHAVLALLLGRAWQGVRAGAG